MQTRLSRAALADVVPAAHGAEPTSRCLPDGDSRSEWCEGGRIDGVPVLIYYMLDPEEDEETIDWSARVDRIEVDLVACDRQGIADAQIEAVIARFGADAGVIARACGYCAGHGIETPAEVKAISIVEGEDPTIIHHVCRDCLENGGYRELSEDEIECSA